MVALEGLTQLEPDSRVTPRLAERWKWEDENRQLRIFIRPNIRFHDGTPLTGAIVADLLERLRKSDNLAESYPSLAEVTEIRTEGDLQLIFRLREPSAFLLEDLSVPLGLGNNIGTGPYRLIGTDGGTWRFERVSDYYLGTPEISEITIRLFDTTRTAWASLLRGDVDMVTDVPASALTFIADDDVQVLSFERWYQFLVAFNSRRGPLASPLVRRALNMAVDRQALVNDALQGAGTPAFGPIWPKHWAYDTTVEPFTFSAGSAAALLDAAGYPMPTSRNALATRRMRFRIDCLIPSDHSALEHVALELQRQLFDIGVDIQFTVLPLDAYGDRIRQGQFEAVLLDMISGPSPARPYSFWRSSRGFKGLNVFGYENPVAEQLFKRLRTAVDDDGTVLSAMGRLQRVIRDDPPALFLAWTERTRAVRREFHVRHDSGSDPLSTIEQWSPVTADASE